MVDAAPAHCARPGARLELRGFIEMLVHDVSIAKPTIEVKQVAHTSEGLGSRSDELR